MNPAETYEHFRTEFPPVWADEHSWANIHDGKATKLHELSEILAKTLGGERAVVVIHTEPGIGAELPLDEVSAFVAPHVLKAEIQVADLRVDVPRIDTTALEPTARKAKRVNKAKVTVKPADADEI